MSDKPKAWNGRALILPWKPQEWNIHREVFWALACNVVGIPVAAAGFLAPWLAGAAMALSSVSVVLNALRLQKARIER